MKELDKEGSDMTFLYRKLFKRMKLRLNRKTNPTDTDLIAAVYFLNGSSDK